VRRRPLQTEAQRVVGAAVREQFGYPRVSNVRMRQLKLACLECGAPMETWRMHRACWVCPNLAHYTGAEWFWSRRLDRKRYGLKLQKKFGNRYVRRYLVRVPPRRVRRAVVFGLIAMVRFAQAHSCASCPAVPSTAQETAR
jgi:hypothetical protein